MPKGLKALWGLPRCPEGAKAIYCVVAASSRLVFRPFGERSKTQYMPKGLKALYLTPEGPRGAKGPSLFFVSLPLWGFQTKKLYMPGGRPQRGRTKADYAPLPRPQRGAEHVVFSPSPKGFQKKKPTTALYMPKGLPEGAKAKGL